MMPGRDQCFAQLRVEGRPGLTWFGVRSGNGLQFVLRHAHRIPDGATVAVSQERAVPRLTVRTLLQC